MRLERVFDRAPESDLTHEPFFCPAFFSLSRTLIGGVCIAAGAIRKLKPHSNPLNRP